LDPQAPDNSTRPGSGCQASAIRAGGLSPGLRRPRASRRMVLGRCGARQPREGEDARVRGATRCPRSVARHMPADRPAPCGVGG
jgi:hypothetical protein